MKFATRHSDWFKRVPKCLLARQERWRGAPPTGAADPRWQEFQRRRLQCRIAAQHSLDSQWNLKPKQRSKLKYWRDLLILLLELFPAFEVLPETRGAKRARVLEPESVKRGARRARSPKSSGKTGKSVALK